MVVYAVARGRNCGIFQDWSSCNESTKNYKNAKFKKFEDEEKAMDWIDYIQNGPKRKKIQSDLKLQYSSGVDYRFYTIDGHRGNRAISIVRENTTAYTTIIPDRLIKNENSTKYFGVLKCLLLNADVREKTCIEISTFNRYVKKNINLWIMNGMRGLEDDKNVFFLNKIRELLKKNENISFVVKHLKNDALESKMVQVMEEKMNKPSNLFSIIQ